MITNETAQQLKDLKEYGNGWFMRFEVNTVFKAWNGILYNKNQLKNDKCEKVFVYDTVEECINAAWDWKVKRRQGSGRKPRTTL